MDQQCEKWKAATAGTDTFENENNRIKNPIVEKVADKICLQVLEA